MFCRDTTHIPPTEAQPGPRSTSTELLEETNGIPGLFNTSSFATDKTLIQPKVVERRNQRLRGIGWRIVLVVFPIALVSALLLGLVVGFCFESPATLFPVDDLPDAACTSILVKYSATQITFWSSLLSMLASVLVGLIMRLWSVYTAKNVQKATQQVGAVPSTLNFPDADEYRCLVGILQASPVELVTYLRQCSKKRFSVPSTLHKAAFVLTLGLLFSFGLFVASSILQNVAETVNAQLITLHPAPTLAFGRGLSKYCLDLNRTANQGFPCSYINMEESQETFAEFALDQEEISLLQHNISWRSEIRLVQDETLRKTAMLIPSSQIVPTSVDYRASTIGVTMKCQPITSKCKMKTAFYPGSEFTQFNCTENFYGVIAKQPNTTYTLPGDKAEDPDLPPMSFKPLSTLQYGFFSGPHLDEVYITGKFDINTGNFDESVPPLPDSALQNPVHLAVAGRIAGTANQPNTDPGFWQGDWGNKDFVLHCYYATYDVQYDWVNGAIHNTVMTMQPNGSLAEMYHGYPWLYASISGNPILQDNMIRAGLQEPTSQGFADKWAALYSIYIMAHLGAFTTPRTNVLEQERSNVLVTQIPRVPLFVLLGLSLVYVVLGCLLGAVAYRAAAAAEVRALADELSFAKVVDKAYRAQEEGQVFSVSRKTTEAVESKPASNKSVAGDADQGKGGGV